MIKTIRDKVPLSETIKKGIYSAGWLTVEKIISMLVGLLVSVFIARSLGVSAYGELSYLLAIIAIVSPLTALGLNGIVVRELVNFPKDEGKIISTVLLFRFIGSIFGLIISICLLYFGNTSFNEIETKNAIIILMSSNALLGSVFDLNFQAKMKVSKTAKMRIVLVLIFSSMKLFQIAFGSDVNSLILIYALEYIVLGCMYCSIHNLNFDKVKFKKINYKYGMELLNQSWWLLLSGVAGLIYLKIDQIMLANIYGAREVGIYAVAVKFSEVWYFFPNAIIMSFFPILLKSKKISKCKYHNDLQKTCDILFIFALLVALLVAFVSDFLIINLYTEEYANSASILKVHVWAGLFVFMRALLSKWLIAEKLHKFSLVTHGSGAIINVLLNLYLIPSYGGFGAAIATIISYSFSSYLSLFLNKKTRFMAMLMTKSIFSPIRYSYLIINRHC